MSTFLSKSSYIEHKSHTVQISFSTFKILGLEKATTAVFSKAKTRKKASVIFPQHFLIDMGMTLKGL